MVSFIPTKESFLAEEPGDASSNKENQNYDQPWRLAGGMLKRVRSRRVREGRFWQWGEWRGLRLDGNVQLNTALRAPTRTDG